PGGDEGRAGEIGAGEPVLRRRDQLAVNDGDGAQRLAAMKPAAAGVDVETLESRRDRQQLRALWAPDTFLGRVRLAGVLGPAAAGEENDDERRANDMGERGQR